MINESLRSNDLRHFIKKVFEIDSFKSKIGNDSDVIVLSFTVDGEDPAKDLENFIEMGYEFVIDADVSTGESDDGTYKVFVEIERTRYATEQIRELLDGVQKLANLETMRFRYFKSFKSQEATLENLEATVPLDKKSYEEATDRNSMNNFSNFFSNSYADELNVVDESISFKRPFSGRVAFNILDSGNKKELYESIRGPIMMESKDMAEVMFLTKIIGNYNITKINNTFIFERNGYAVALERKE
jgi:hypothetical protein